MKKITFVFSLAFLFCYGLYAQSDTSISIETPCSAGDATSIAIVLETTNPTRGAVPFNLWNSVTFTISYPAVAGVCVTPIASISNESTFNFATSPSTTPPLLDGGICYELIQSTNGSVPFSLTAGTPAEVACISLVGTGCSDFTIVTGDASLPTALQSGAGTNGNASVNVAVAQDPADGNEFSGFGTATQSCVPLPVELVSMSANPKGSAISVDWVSVSELDFQGYQLERSLDGATFEKLGWIQGETNSIESKVYNYLDLNVKGGVVYYYRLKMIDLDGSYSYSPIRSAQVGGKGGSVSVFPNPTSTVANLTIDAPQDDRVSIRFYDTTGKVVLERTQDLNEGNNLLEYSISDLPSGLYRIVVSGQQIRATQNIVVAE